MDIFLSILVFALSAAMAYLGVHLTLHPAETEKQKHIYMVAFLLMAVVSAPLIGVQAYLARQIQSALQGRLDDIDKNTRNPPRVEVNVPATQVITGGFGSGFLQFDGAGPTRAQPNLFVLDQPFELNAWYENKGTTPVYDAASRTDFYIVKLQPGDHSITDRIVYKDFMAKVTKRPPPRGITLGVGVPMYTTPATPPLTSEILNDLIQGKTVLYVMGYAIWHDSGGSKKNLSSCSYVQQPPRENIPATDIVIVACDL